jgi:hypothetical protein
VLAETGCVVTPIELDSATAGRSLDAETLELAVVASVRHQDTAYDELLMSGLERADARERVRDEVARMLESWRPAALSFQRRNREDATESPWQRTP